MGKLKRVKSIKAAPALPLPRLTGEWLKRAREAEERFLAFASKLPPFPVSVLAFSYLPSNDTAAVKIEIRATEIACHMLGMFYDFAHTSPTESMGWSAHGFNLDYRRQYGPKAEWQAGWLAREIFWTKG